VNVLLDTWVPIALNWTADIVTQKAGFVFKEYVTVSRDTRDIIVPPALVQTIALVMVYA
jgi:hypothetical protein